MSISTETFNNIPKKRTCSECGEKHYAKGLCIIHYNRMTYEVRGRKYHKKWMQKHYVKGRDFRKKRKLVKRTKESTCEIIYDSTKVGIQDPNSLFHNQKLVTAITLETK